MNSHLILWHKFPVPHLSSDFIFVVLGLRCYMGFSLVADSGGYFLAVMCGLLIVVASLVAEYRF